MADTQDSQDAEAPDEDLQEQLYLLLSTEPKAEEALEGEAGAQDALLETLAEPAAPDTAVAEVVIESEEASVDFAGAEGAEDARESPPAVLELNLEVPAMEANAGSEGDDADTEPPDEVPDAQALDAELHIEEEDEELAQDEMLDEVPLEGDLASEEEEYSEEDLPEDAMALPVDVEPLPPSPTEATDIRPPLPPRLQVLRRLLEAPAGPCEELKLSYRDFLRRLCERAAASGEPLAARDKVSFRVNVKASPAIPPSIRVAPTASPVLLVVDGESGDELEQESKVSAAVIAETKAAQAQKSAAYASVAAPLVLLRKYLSQDRWVGAADGSLLFEDDDVRYPLSTPTPLRAELSAKAELLSLGSLFLVALLRERYQGFATPDLLDSLSAKRIRAQNVPPLLDFLLGRSTSCPLLLPATRTKEVPAAEPADLLSVLGAPRIASSSASNFPPVSSEELSTVPGQAEVEDDQEAEADSAEEESSTEQVTASSDQESEAAEETSEKGVPGRSPPPPPPLPTSSPEAEQAFSEGETTARMPPPPPPLPPSSPEAEKTSEKAIPVSQSMAERLQSLKEKLARENGDKALGRKTAEGLREAATLKARISRLEAEEMALRKLAADLEATLAESAEQLDVAKAEKRRLEQELQDELQASSKKRRIEGRDDDSSAFQDPVARQDHIRLKMLLRLLAPLVTD